MHYQDNLLQFCCYQINLTQPIKVKSIQSIHHVIVKLCDFVMTLISPLGSISEGGRGPQSTRAQLEKGLPALYGLKLVEDLLLEYEPLISSLVVKFPDVRYVWNPKIYFIHFMR